MTFGLAHIVLIIIIVVLLYLHSIDICRFKCTTVDQVLTHAQYCDDKCKDCPCVRKDTKVEHFLSLGKFTGKEHMNGSVEYLRSNVDGDNYLIQRGLPDKQGAADLLSDINLSLIHI